MVVNAGAEGLYVTCSQEKWNKGKAYVNELQCAIVSNGWDTLDRKELERKRGFLVHMSRTFSYMTPYLKGLHLTLETFRPDRLPSGWKMSKKDWAAKFSGESGEEIPKAELDDRIKDAKRALTPDTLPERVKIAPRLASDIQALWKLFQLEEPPLRLIRGRAIHEAVYGFGDASGSGFGSTWEVNGTLRYRLGVWGSDGEGTSSNYRELKNLVQTLSKMGSQGVLTGREIFLFTDNTTSELAFYNGTSSSKALFDLVLEARALEGTAGCIIRLVHVPGKRMIDQGTDGLSRGNFNEGVMGGRSMLSCVPLTESATERDPEIKEWVNSWTEGGKLRGKETVWLEPKDWFVRGHDIVGSDKNIDGRWIPKFETGTYIWTPPPVVASFAVDQLRKARHKRTDSIHIFLCPELYHTQWKKSLRKVADVLIDIPPRLTFGHLLDLRN